MNFTKLSIKSNNNSGIVLIVVLWILMILAVLAIGLGRKSKVELSLTKHYIGKLKSRYVAWAGLMYAIKQIEKDNKDDLGKTFDTLGQCGFTLEEGKSSEEMFKDVSVGDGGFEIAHSVVDPENESFKMVYGFTDEDRKINLNAITKDNYGILQHLLTILGVEEEETAQIIAASVADWHDADLGAVGSFTEVLGAEDDYYSHLSQPYHCKNLPFDSIQELLLVRGMTSEIYSKIKNFVTVFPKDAPQLVVNINTASEEVLMALARYYSIGKGLAEEGDADSLGVKILAHRAGEDGQIMTEDDRYDIMNESLLIKSEWAIFQAMKIHLTTLSKYLNIHIKAKDKKSNVVSNMEAVIFRDQLSIVGWRRY